MTTDVKSVLLLSSLFPKYILYLKLEVNQFNFQAALMKSEQGQAKATFQDFLAGAVSNKEQLGDLCPHPLKKIEHGICFSKTDKMVMLKYCNYIDESKTFASDSLVTTL